MNPNDFVFLPVLYDRIIYLDQDMLVIGTPGISMSKTKQHDVGSGFIPVVLISLNGEDWFSSDYPPVSSGGIPLAGAQAFVAPTEITILGSRSTSGNLYVRVMGIEL